MSDYDNHRCIGSLDAHCSIRRYPAQTSGYAYKDGYWHLYQGDYDFDYMTGYLRDVTRIKYCPWCGEEL